MENSRIIIIDCAASAARFTKDCLSALRYECDIETRAARALDMALSGEYVCVILETVIGNTDGFKLCADIRGSSGIPIIFISSDSSDASKVRAFSAGGDDYITKPFSISETVARIGRHIARYLQSNTTQRSGRTVKIRGLEINKDSHRVFVDGKEVFMPVKEYELLLFLAENPNMVFSKEHLLDRVWGIDAVGDSSTVTVHIQRIREKIETNASYIETVWGAGYRMNSN